MSDTGRKEEKEQVQEDIATTDLTCMCNTVGHKVR